MVNNNSLKQQTLRFTIYLAGYSKDLEYRQIVKENYGQYFNILDPMTITFEEVYADIGKELSDNEKFDLDNRIEDFFYASGLKCRKETYFFRDGFEFYVTDLDIDIRKLIHIRDSFPKFNRVLVSSDIDQGFASLSVKLLL